MKLKFILDEHFMSDEKADEHYGEHVIDGDLREFPSTLYPNVKAYVKGGDKLAKKPCSGSNIGDGDIIGFKSKRNGGCYIKYDRPHHTMVAYKLDPSQPCGILLFTYHKYRDADNRYERMKESCMIGEIPEGE